MGLQISHQYSCIFVHIPKTAGSSIESSTIFRDARRVKNSHCGHSSALLFQALFPDEFKSYYKFAFVRNPWDRLVSAYFHFREEYGSQYETMVSKKYLKKYSDFFIFCKDFVNEEGINKIIHFRPQYDYISNENDEIIVDFVGRFENIQEDFAFVCNRLGASCNLQYKRKSKHRHYSTYYNAETIKIVSRVYQKDIELFDYAFEFRKFRDVHYYLNYVPDEIKKGLKIVRNFIAGQT